MKVLHFYKTYLPDGFAGVERVIWNICESTHAHGVESDVLALSAAPPPVPLPVGHHIAHHASQDLYLASTGLSVSVFAKFAELARQADIVHFHFPWPMMDLVNLVVRLRCATVVTYHSDIIKQKTLARLYAPLMHQFLGQMDQIVATSPNYLESSPVLQRYAAKTSVIPIGIEPLAAPPRPDLLDRWRKAVGEEFFLFVGAPRYYKGLEFLLGAARQTGLPVVIAGAEEAEIFGVSGHRPGNVHVVGRVNDADKEALLRLARAFVFPSHLRSEAFGVALLEAARAGKPMISCEIGTGTSYVNLADQTGFVIAPQDVAALSESMQKLANSDVLTTAMGAVATQRFAAEFTAGTMGKRYFDLYDRLLKSRN
ncbi:MAG: glycosyltransferase [Alphaproteobacteria bacterium]|nr:glycosyltransferase [Alphaproteobacteria bacterium]MBU1562595.1 glycosyltransferase [Alphaproteobacteria bacterium]MBU2303237.1 glycosyltransferase [Alphaproteobacteria bacterium]MBU2370372.1 glycosyltransferase [Alphaproteobacteria bacterium]